MRPAMMLWAAAIALPACAPAAEPVARSPGLTGMLFVANKFGNTLSQVDLATGEERRRVPACANPHELATSPDGRHVALACYGGTSISLFATSDLTRVGSIELGENARPHGIVWHANGDLYATAEGRKSVFWIKDPLSAAPELLEYATGQEGSHMLAVSPDGAYAWTTDLGSKTVTRLDLETRRAPRSVEVGIEPEGIALTRDGGTLWVSARGSDKAFALDPRSLAIGNEVDTGDFPLRIAIRPQGDFAITSNLADGSLSVIDLQTARVVRTIAVSNREEAQERFQVTILWSKDGEHIYVAETASDTVAEVDFATGEVLRRIAVGDGGDGLAIVE